MRKTMAYGREIFSDAELEKWATKRLLRYYKAVRNTVMGITEFQRQSEYCKKDIDTLTQYSVRIKALLDKREHVCHAKPKKI